MAIGITMNEPRAANIEIERYISDLNRLLRSTDDERFAEEVFRAAELRAEVRRERSNDDSPREHSGTRLRIFNKGAGSFCGMIILQLLCFFMLYLVLPGCAMALLYLVYRYPIPAAAVFLFLVSFENFILRPDDPRGPIWATEYGA